MLSLDGYTQYFLVVFVLFLFLTEVNFAFFSKSPDFSITKSYSLKDLFTTSLILAPIKLTKPITFAMTFSVSMFVYNNRLFNISAPPLLYWLVLFLLVEFFYYWNHRVQHTVNWLWATHSVHHSCTKMNTVALLRVSLTGALSGNFLFYLPIAFLGFHPVFISLIFSMGVIYQIWVHTEVVGSLGWFDSICNTPANHRVHHSALSEELDKNFGAVLMLFDHLFGTYAVEKSRHGEYGIHGQSANFNPVKIVIMPWATMFSAASKAKGLDVFKVLFGYPGAYEKVGAAFLRENSQGGSGLAPVLQPPLEGLNSLKGGAQDDKAGRKMTLPSATSPFAD